MLVAALRGMGFSRLWFPGKLYGAREQGLPPRYGVLMGMGQAVTASRAALASSTRASSCLGKLLFR